MSCAEDHDDDGVVGRGGHARHSATDTSASTAIALTRAWLDAVARISAAIKLTRAWLVALPRTSAAIEVTRLSAISGHDLRPDLQAVHPA